MFHILLRFFINILSNYPFSSTKCWGRRSIYKTLCTHLLTINNKTNKMYVKLKEGKTHYNTTIHAVSYVVGCVLPSESRTTQKLFDIRLYSKVVQQGFCSPPPPPYAKKFTNRIVHYCNILFLTNFNSIFFIWFRLEKKFT